MVAFAGSGRADVISDVNQDLLTIIANTSPALIDGPPNVAREIAMVDGAMYDAVNAATGGIGSTQSLYYTGGPIANANAATAALSAAYTVMNNLYGTSSLYSTLQGQTITYNGQTLQVAPSAAQYAGITAQLNNVLTELNATATAANTASTGTGTTGQTLGTAAANAMIAGRASDNGTAAMLSTIQAPNTTYQGVTTAGVYADPTSRPALEPTAGNVTTFVSTASQQTAAVASVSGPPPVGSAAYAAQVLQTECQGSSGVLPPSVVSACQAAGWTPQTGAQAQSALYWNDPGGTYQPPGHWLQIADAAAASTNLSLLQHAQEDALVGAAMSDAGSAAWDVKFTDDRWRPITAIQNCATWNNAYFPSGACDPTWNSLIATPPHPDYLAGHPAFSGAAATVLDNFFQTDNVGFTVSSQVYCNTGSTQRDSLGNIVSCTLNGTVYTYNPNDLSDCNNAATQPPLNADYTVNPLYNNSPLICPMAESFAGFQDASSGDLGSTFSRVVGGIHTPQAVTDALALGNQIGQTVANDANIPEPGPLAVLAVALAGIAAVRRRGVAGG
jgi:hypothetical protein